MINLLRASFTVDYASQLNMLRVGAFVAPLTALALTVAAQLPAPAAADVTEPVYMSALRVEGLEGYPVHDETGAWIGDVTRVEADEQGRTRYINLTLSDGREARLSSFRARLDETAGRVDLVMPRYAVELAASAPPMTTASVATASADAEASLAQTISLTQ